MSVEQNKAIVLRFFEEVRNKADPAAVDEIVAPTYVHHTAAGPEVGPDVLKRNVARNLAALGFRFTVEDVCAEGDKVAVRWTWRGTHKGDWETPWGVLHPTGRQMAGTAISFVRIVDGKIAEMWQEGDSLGQWLQLGVIPVPARATT
jgi:predicted ester cyclase